MDKHTIVPASYLVLFQDNKVLLLRRFNTWYKDGHYSMIAGHVEKWESFRDCIIREAKEEAGRLDNFFVVRKWEWKIINKEPHKCDDLSWFDLDNLPENTLPYIKHILQEIKDNNHYSEYGWEKSQK